MFDGEAFGQQMVAIVRDYMAGEIEPLRAENKALIERIAALESREMPIADKGDTGEPGRDGTDGRDADPEQVKALVEATVAEALPLAVEAAVAAIPPAEKGEPGERGEPGEKGDAGQPGEPGKDGVGLAGLMIDREGEAVATLSDGTMVKLGPVVGRDGKDGQPGEPGKDGRDGRDLDDLQVTQEGSVVEFAFQIGDVRSLYEIELPQGPAGADGQDAYPGMAKGLFDPEAEYRAMDVVGFNGSEWRAKQDNPGELPGSGWMLSVPRGKRGERGEQGKAGRDGLTPVAHYLRGSELVTTLSDGAELTADLSGLTGE